MLISTLKEFMQYYHPRAIGPMFRGGVSGCPHGIPDVLKPHTTDFDRPHYCCRTPDCCEHCWNRKLTHPFTAPDTLIDVAQLSDTELISHFRELTGISLRDYLATLREDEGLLQSMINWYAIASEQKKRGAE